MTRYVYEIKGPPVAWSSHRGFGKKSFNPHYKEKEAAQWSLKLQHRDRPLLDGAVRVDFFFEVPVPKSLSKELQKRILSGEKIFCPKRPDATNYRKHIEDALTGTVLTDDNIIVSGETQKFYARRYPRTLIIVNDNVRYLNFSGDLESETDKYASKLYKWDDDNKIQGEIHERIRSREISIRINGECDRKPPI